MANDRRTQPKKINQLFSRIAARYESMNRLMTAGQDERWRVRVIELADIKPGARVLDLGAGTGDLTREALRFQPIANVIMVDFTFGMLMRGKEKGDFPCAVADAMTLPFPDESFDIVISGFLLRNVTDLKAALREQFRVLKPGGRMVALDTTRPTKNLLYPLIWIYMQGVIPILGWLITGSWGAYRYLVESTEKFLSAEELAALMAETGFRDVQFERRMVGTIAIHWSNS